MSKPSAAETVLGIVFGLLRDRFGGNVPGAALDAIIPLLIELLRPSLREADERARAHIQASIDDALRKAGLITDER